MENTSEFNGNYHISSKNNQTPSFLAELKKVFWPALIGLILLGVSLVVNYYAGSYATLHESNAVHDIILDNIPVFDVDGLFVYGMVAFFTFVTALMIFRPRRMPFVLKAMSLFILVRSFFIILTHIGPSAQAVIIPGDSIASYFTFTGDLFFSAHTGLPFLMALIYWDSKALRTFFLLTSMFMGVVVLLGHLHYSIDVFSAYFITYGIFQIAKRFFSDDHQLLLN